jgi:hypothetical protein
VQIRLGRRQIQQFGGIGQAAAEPIEAANDLFELGAFLSQLLSAVGVAPNTGLFELALYFLQPLVLVVVIKDTSSKSRRALRDL